MLSSLRQSPHMIAARMQQIIRRRSFYIGLAIAGARFLNLLGFAMLVLWSYSLWGSETSPLASLLIPGIILIVISIALRILIVWLARWMGRATRLQQRRRAVQRKVRLSRESVERPKL
ncbi:hypothetical protein BH09SUM1_BH09SUM1_16190 [soil metagenome]